MGTWRSTTLTVAGGSAEPLEGDNTLSSRWKDRKIPFPGLVELGIRATDANVVVSVQSGSEILLEESPVDAGGTINVFPIFPDNIDLVDEVAAGDLFKIRLRNTHASATPSVMITLRYTPA